MHALTPINVGRWYQSLFQMILGFGASQLQCMGLRSLDLLPPSSLGTQVLQPEGQGAKSMGEYAKRWRDLKVKGNFQPAGGPTDSVLLRGVHLCKQNHLILNVVPVHTMGYPHGARWPIPQKTREAALLCTQWLGLHHLRETGSGVTKMLCRKSQCSLAFKCAHSPRHIYCAQDHTLQCLLLIVNNRI